MAYGDYGAFVYFNGNRMEKFEDCSFNGNLAHGLIQEGDISVKCYKQGLPTIFYKGDEVEYYRDEVDFFEFEPFSYELDGYKFYFCNEDKPYIVEMTTPNGDVWRCEYDYMYGAGF